MIESYYTPEQLETLRKGAEQLGPERIQRSHEEWAELIAQVRAEMEKGTDPAAPEVQAMAEHWMELVNAFTGGDPAMERSVGRVWKEQGDNIAAQYGSQYDPRGVSDYIGRAISILKGK